MTGESHVRSRMPDLSNADILIRLDLEREKS